MSKILVIGAKGFIGNALALTLDKDISEIETLVKFSQEKISHVTHLAGNTLPFRHWSKRLF